MPQMPQRPRSLRSTLAWNTASQIVGRAVSAFTTLGITMLIARAYGTSGYGEFVKITTFVAFFYLLADFGFNALFLQKSPISNQDVQPADDTGWRDLLGLRIFVSCFLVFVALAILALIPQGTTQGYTGLVRIGILLFVPTIVFQALTTTANALFQKHLRYDLATIGIVVGSFVSLGLVWVTTRGGVPSGIMPGVVSLLIGSAATAIVGLRFVRTFVKSIHISFSFTRLTSLFVASLPLGLTLLFNLVYFHVDSVILTLTRSTAEVGIYGLVYKVFELPLVVPTFFMNALYPVMLQMKKRDLGLNLPAGKAGIKDLRIYNQEFISLVSRSALFLFLISLILSLVLWFAAPLIVLIKRDFLSGISALRILSLGLPFFFLSSLTMWILIAARKQTILAYIYGVSMLMNISLNILYIPVFGYMAAAWITVVSEAVVLLLSSVVVLKILNLKS